MQSDSALFSPQFVSFALVIQYRWDHNLITTQEKRPVFHDFYVRKNNELYLLLLSFERYFSGKPRFQCFYCWYFFITTQEEILIIL
jgi:hypothetical protein